MSTFSVLLLFLSFYEFLLRLQSVVCSFSIPVHFLLSHSFFACFHLVLFFSYFERFLYLFYFFIRSTNSSVIGYFLSGLFILTALTSNSFKLFLISSKGSCFSCFFLTATEYMYLQIELTRILLHCSLDIAWVSLILSVVPSHMVD